MSLQFFLGTGEKNHEIALLKKAQEWLAKSESHRVSYIVPNSSKFELEVSLLTQFGALTGSSEIFANLRLQVLSFSRLAWYFLQNTSYSVNDYLSDMGRILVMKKSLREVESRLAIYRGETTKVGFLKQLVSLYEEFAVVGIEGDLLLATTEKFAENEKATRLKLQELQLIFDTYEQNLLSYGIEKISVLENLAIFLKDVDLSETLFLISGYSHFSSLELQLVERLMIQSQVKIALITDSVNVSETLIESDLFYDSKLLYQQCLNLAKTHQMPVFFDVWIKEEHKLSSSIKSLEEYWRTANDFSKDQVYKSFSGDNFRIIQANSPFREVLWVAKEIYRLTVEDQVRFKEIVILTRDLNTYSRLMEPIFQAHQIPFISGKDQKMRQHPFVEFLQSLFSVKKYYFRYEDVFRLLRTEFLVPQKRDEEQSLKECYENLKAFREAVDVTENIALRYGYEHADWMLDGDWSFVTYNSEEGDKNHQLENQVNGVRSFVQKTLCPFWDKLDDLSGKGTCKEAAQIFYEFLLEVQVDQQLLFFRDQAVSEGNLERAVHFDQAWNAFVRLLDEYVKIFGDTIFDLVEFMELFSTGLEEMSFGVVPAMIDKVEVTSMELARPAQAKYVFVLGSNEDNLPHVLENTSLLSQEERALLRENLPILAASGLKNVERVNANEIYLMYRLLLSASKRLYFSYSTNIEERVGIHLSPYLKKMAADLSIEIQKISAPSILQKDGVNLLPHISTYRALLTDLVNILQQQQDLSISPARFWNHLQTLLMKSELGDLARKVFTSLSSKNVPENLPRDLAESLYGKKLQASVSRFETFYQCEYQYFLTSGLQLKERDVFELNSAIAGSFYHEVLDVFFKTLIAQQISLSELSEIQLEQYSEDSFARVLEESPFAVFKRSARMKMIAKNLSQTLQRALWAMSLQNKRMSLQPSATEVLFGQLGVRRGISGMNFSLSNGAKLFIRGKIDRLDIDSERLAVVDYKSSNQSFDLASVYYGTAMQMVTYLDIATQSSQQLFGNLLRPVGSFYLHVYSPKIKYEGQEMEKFSELLFNEFRFKGMLIHDESLINLDQTLVAGEKSQVYPLKLKKDGSMDQATAANAYTPDEFKLIRWFNQRNFVQAAEKILSGEIALNPLMESKDKRACQYCSYRNVCKFDATLKENEYRRMEKFGREKKKVILQRMKETLERDNA
ncbi:MAG: PD-(D/E)XK nuclease family protein [Lactobacillales bacterium]|jgi:ATP-dependent helicase/nuclease subunit B|nr:PD-(D/E)XK nuclease family protein [Lactobacillales bacterium]